MIRKDAHDGLRLCSILAVFIAVFGAGGCFSQRSFTFSPREFVPVETQLDESMDFAWNWLSVTHSHLAKLLPDQKHAALLTGDMGRSTSEGDRPLDVLAYFKRDPKRLASIWSNLSGLEHTAQCTGADSSDVAPPDWPDFTDVWIPVAPGLELSARIGLAMDGDRPRRANCIIVLPGLMGDNQVWRTRDICEALRANGLHAVALESRGFGRTGARYPDVYYTFGVLETFDLLAAADWLEARPEVAEVGVIGFCWSANKALLAAWAAGSGEREWLPNPRRTKSQLRAGVMAFSPVLRFEEIVADCERPWGLLENPVLNHLQETIAGRMRHKAHPEITGSLASLIRFEFARSELNRPEDVERGYTFLRLLPYGDKPAIPRMRQIRTPTLIVQGANDPLTSAQNVADLTVSGPNLNVAAIILPGGGHVGFAAYAREYFYNLILNFYLHGPQPFAINAGPTEERAASREALENN